jgi:hypothetical protein
MSPPGSSHKTTLFALLFFAPLLFLSLAIPRTAWSNEILVLDSGPTTLLVEVTTTDYRLEPLAGSAEGYLRIRAPGCGYTSQKSKPLLPTRGFLVGIPLQGTPAVAVLEEEWTTLETGLICPVPEAALDRWTDKGPAGWKFSSDLEIYGRDAFYPTVLAEMELLGYFRDQRVGRVQLFPFRYNPVSRQLKVCRRLLVQVNFPPQAPSTSSGTARLTTAPAAEDVLSNVLLNYPQAKSWRQELTAPGFLRASGNAEYSQRCKITISEDGLYAIGPSELEKVGLNLGGIDPRTFQLSNRGQTVPIYVRGEKDGSFDAKDVIEFYGQANRETYLAKHEDMVQDPYSSKNVYWLSWNSEPGTRLVEEDGGIQALLPRKPISYEYTVHAEEDNHRNHLDKQFSLRDHWFWDSGVSATEMREYPIQLPHPDRGSPLRPRVRAMLHGLTSSQEHEPDHHVLIYLNDHLVADRTWDGQEKLLIDSAEDGFEIFSSAVQEGDNTLALICPGDTDAGPIDRILFNWFQVEYPRLYRAEGNMLQFSKPKGGPAGLYQFTIKGFTSPSVWIYKLGTSVMVNGQGEWVEDDKGSHYQLTFQDEIYDGQTTYLAVTSSAKKTVESIELRSVSSLRASGKGADQVIIVHQDFYESILPLAELRANQGLRVEVVEVGQVYDQFGHGLFTPEAIRDFLKYTYQNWDPQPLYVLLVGDGSWDYKNTMGLGGNYIPPIMVQTAQWGSAPADNIYACVSGDDELPDLFVGRLPVRSNSQLDAVIDKIIGGEEEPELGDWRRRLLFICGSGEHGPIFRSQSEWLIEDHVTPDFLISRVYAHSSNPGTDPAYGGTQDLIDALDEGASLVNYIGHGGGGIWSDAGLMRLEDVNRLRNARRWPMVFSLTCFTAAFDEPKRDCLGERLLLAEDRGVTAFLGSSGVGWLWGDYNLNDGLMETLISGQGRIFGQVVTETKLRYSAKYSGQIASDLVNEYILMGDPASRIGFPQKKVSLSAHPEAVNPGDALSIQGTTGGDDQGQAQLTILDGSGAAIWESLLPVVDGQFQANVSLSPTCSTGTGIVRCYFRDSQDMIDGVGAASFALGRVFFDTVFTDPKVPATDDTVHVWAQISAPQGVDSVLCRWRRGAVNLTQRMIPQISPGEYRTAQPIPAYSAGTTVYYWVVVTDSAGQQTTSNQHTYRLPSLTDLHIPPEDMVVAGQTEVGISLKVENSGDTSAESVLVRLTITEPVERSDSREGFIEHLPGGAEATLFLPWDLPLNSYQIRAQVDPEDTIPEGDEDNNTAYGQIDVDRVNVTPQEGTAVNGQHAPAFSLDGNFSCQIPAGVVSQRQVLSILPEAPQVWNQPDLTPARLATGERLAYHLTLADSSAAIAESPQILLTFKLDGQDSLNFSQGDMLAVYRWSSKIRKWIRHAEVSWPAPDSVSASVSGLGLFCPIVNQDQVPPSIEVTVEDQRFAEGALVSSNAKIVAVIQDANGVDVVEHQVEVWHNGQPVTDQQIVCSPSPERNSIPVSYSAVLPTGKHTVTFAASDCNGNAASKTTEFQVIGSPGIQQTGNYPNPFDRETAFTYRLTGPDHAREISLKIYTVSGRLVKSFHDFTDEFGRPGTQLDYHVKTWDGRDEDGNPLANGVYFYKIRAKWEDQEVQKTGKLAILR